MSVIGPTALVNHGTSITHVWLFERQVIDLARMDFLFQFDFRRLVLPLCLSMSLLDLEIFPYDPEERYKKYNHSCDPNGGHSIQEHSSPRIFVWESIPESQTVHEFREGSYKTHFAKKQEEREDTTSDVVHVWPQLCVDKELKITYIF